MAVVTIRLPAAVCRRAAQHRHVVGLGAAGGENDLPGSADKEAATACRARETSFEPPAPFYAGTTDSRSTGSSAPSPFQRFFHTPGWLRCCPNRFPSRDSLQPTRFYQLASSGRKRPEKFKDNLLYNKYIEQANKFDGWKKGNRQPKNNGACGAQAPLRWVFQNAGSARRIGKNQNL